MHLREEFLVMSSSKLLAYKVRLMNFKWVLDHQSTVQNTNEKKGQSVYEMHIIHCQRQGPNLRILDNTNVIHKVAKMPFSPS